MEGVLMRRLCMVAYKTMSLTLATISTSFLSVLYFYLFRNVSHFLMSMTPWLNIMVRMSALRQSENL